LGNLPESIKYWNAMHPTKLDQVENLEHIGDYLDDFAKDANRDKAMVMVGFKKPESKLAGQSHLQLLSLQKNKSGKISAQVFEPAILPVLPTDVNIKPYFKALKDRPNVYLNLNQMGSQYSGYDCCMFLFHLLKRFEKQPQFLEDIHKATFDRNDSFFSHATEQNEAMVRYQNTYESESVGSIELYFLGAKELLENEHSEKLNKQIRIYDARRYLPAWAYGMTHSKTGLETTKRIQQEIQNPKHENFSTKPLNNKKENIMDYAKKFTVTFANKANFREYFGTAEYFRSRLLGNARADLAEALEELTGEKNDYLRDSPYLLQMPDLALSKRERNLKAMLIEQEETTKPNLIA
jgi:hypothetical protein